MGSYGTVGLEMVLSVLFGLFGGRWLDGKLGTAPVLMIVGFGFGVAAAVRALIRSLRQMQRATAEDGWRASETDRPARFALGEREAAQGQSSPDGEQGPSAAASPPGTQRARRPPSPDEGGR